MKFAIAGLALSGLASSAVAVTTDPPDPVTIQPMVIQDPILINTLPTLTYQTYTIQTYQVNLPLNQMFFQIPTTTGSMSAVPLPMTLPLLLAGLGGLALAQRRKALA